MLIDDTMKSCSNAITISFVHHFMIPSLTNLIIRTCKEEPHKDVFPTNPYESDRFIPLSISSTPPPPPFKVDLSCAHDVVNFKLSCLLYFSPCHWGFFFGGVIDATLATAISTNNRSWTCTHKKKQGGISHYINTVTDNIHRNGI